MEIFKALAQRSRRVDNAPLERLEYNRVHATIESQCEEYLTRPGDIFYFEALPSAIDAAVSVLEGVAFQEKYEFMQVSETCFAVRLRELDILG